MTSPASRYWEASSRSTRRWPASALHGRPLTGLELRRIDDLHVGERLLRLGVLHDQHGRRPLLPVGALAAREAHGGVPALELVLEQRLDDLLGLVALGRVDGVGDDPHLGIAVEGAVDRLLLELLHVLLAEGLAPGGGVTGGVGVHDA